MSTPQIVGILNITPDSFSDGGDSYRVLDAMNHAREMITSGVSIIDVGAVSTRPKGDFISYDDEIQRLKTIVPELRNFLAGTNIRISLDSYNYQTIAEFISDIDIINDVTGLNDVNMQAVTLESGKEAIFMHSMSVPVNNTLYCLDTKIDIIEFLLNWRDRKIETLTAKGFKLENLVFDPGIGFGKDAHQSMSIIARIDELVSGDVKIMIGHSRKSFLTLCGESDAKKRDLETHIITNFLLDKNINYLRVHDVLGTCRVLKLYNYINYRVRW